MVSGDEWWSGGVVSGAAACRLWLLAARLTLIASLNLTTIPASIGDLAAYSASNASAVAAWRSGDGGFGGAAASTASAPPPSSSAAVAAAAVAGEYSMGSDWCGGACSSTRSSSSRYRSVASTRNSARNNALCITPNGPPHTRLGTLPDCNSIVPRASSVGGVIGMPLELTKAVCRQRRSCHAQTVGPRAAGGSSGRRMVGGGRSRGGGFAFFALSAAAAAEGGPVTGGCFGSLLVEVGLASVASSSSERFFDAGALLLDVLAGLDAAAAAAADGFAAAAADGLAKASLSDESSFTGFATFFFFGSATSFFFETAGFSAGGGASATGFGSSGGGTLALLEEEAAGCSLTGAAAAEEEGLFAPAFSGPTVGLLDAAAAGVAGRGAKKLSFDCVSGI